VGLISLALADIILTFHFMFPFCRAATGVRDETLDARALAGDGKLKEERYAKVEVMSSSLVSEAR
jgi:hypothetical protein